MIQNQLTHHNLGKRIILGGFWMIMARLITRSSGVLVSLILARILTPEDFGLVGIGVLVISLFKVFTEMGIEQALIHEKDIDNDILNTAWIVNLCRGFLISTACYFSAPMIALFFKEPNATPIIRALGISPFIHGITNIRTTCILKEMEFKKQFFYEISALSGPLLVSIPLSLLLRNVWAMVYGTLFSALLQVIVSYFLAPFYPRLTFSFNHFKKLFSFGKWIFLSSIVSYFAMELDTYAAGKLFDSHVLGFYILAFTISNKPVLDIGKALSKVLFPAFTKISANPDRIRDLFLKSSSVLYAVILPICLIIITVADDFTIHILGPQWKGIAPLLQLLSAAAMLRAMAVPAGGLFYGIGHSHTIFVLSLSRLLGFVLPLTIFWDKLSLNYLAISVLISNSVYFGLFMFFTIRYTRITIFDWFNNTFYLLLTFLPLVCSILVLRIFLQGSIYRVFLPPVVGLFIYSLFIFSLWHFYNKGPFSVLKSLTRSFLPNTI